MYLFLFILVFEKPLLPSTLKTVRPGDKDYEKTVERGLNEEDDRSNQCQRQKTIQMIVILN